MAQLLRAAEVLELLAGDHEAVRRVAEALERQGYPTLTTARVRELLFEAAAEARGDRDVSLSLARR